MTDWRLGTVAMFAFFASAPLIRAAGPLAISVEGKTTIEQERAAWQAYQQFAKRPDPSSAGTPTAEGRDSSAPERRAPAKVTAPQISPAPSSPGAPIQVSIACPTEGATVRYTTDGSTPTSKSTAYRCPLILLESATVKARAFRSGMADSDVASKSVQVSVQELFDDFSYSTLADLKSNGWVVRAGPGGPGVQGATWSASHVSFLEDPQGKGNRLLRLKASSSGTPNHTVQSEIHRTAFKYQHGTYAARVYFRDAPSDGAPDGDRLVETFYAICPYGRYERTEDYSELDFEYLPNGGWGRAKPTIWMCSWRRVRPKDNAPTAYEASMHGWHVLVVQSSPSGVSYFIDSDSNCVAKHPGKYAPRVGMAISFNFWFDGLAAGSTDRSYHQDVDWVYFAKDCSLSPSLIQSRVDALRASCRYKDSVD